MQNPKGINLKRLASNKLFNTIILLKDVRQNIAIPREVLQCVGSHRLTMICVVCHSAGAGTTGLAFAIWSCRRIDPHG